MRILGVDPGLTRCGLGVIDTRRGREVSLVAVDVVRTDAAAAPEQRLLAMAAAFDRWIAEHRPDAVAVERVFAQHNLRTVTGTAQVAGLAMVAAGRAGIPVALHTPSEVKAAVTGSGRAQKAQVQEMVRRILGLDEAPTPADAADALAIAVTHGWRGAAAVIPLPARGAPTAAQRVWAEAAAGTAARAGAARRQRLRGAPG